MFPPLYECSRCGGAVYVDPQGEGVEPVKRFPCGHDDATIWANRKVTLRGKGGIDGMSGVAVRVTLTLRQWISALTGRSV